MTVLMTDDQLQVLIATMRGITDSNQKMNLLRSWAGAELMDQVWPGTREGEGEVAVQALTYEQVVESTELTQPKLDTEATRDVERNKIRLKMDRMWPGTREWEVAVQAHTYEQVGESTELTLHKLDQVWPGTREGEVAVQAHIYEQVVESTELTQLKLDTKATREVEMNKIRLKLDRM